MRRRKLYPLALGLLCAASYALSRKASLAMTLSDTCFLVGMAWLIVGLAAVVRRTGFFFLPAYGIKLFFSLFANRGGPRATAGESYEAYLRKRAPSGSTAIPLALAAVALGLSALFASLR